MDLEDELMTLAQNEMAYLPSKNPKIENEASAKMTTETIHTRVQQMLAQADAMRQQQQQMTVNIDRLQLIQRLIAQKKDMLVRFVQRHAHHSDITTSGEAQAQQLHVKLNHVVEESAREVENPSQECIWTELLALLPSEERDYVAKSADEQFEERLKYIRQRSDNEDERFHDIRRHLSAVFQSETISRRKNGQQIVKCADHSLGQMLQDIAAIFRACYENSLRAVDHITLVLPLVAVDVHQCAAMLQQLVLFKYKSLETVDEAKDYVHRVVLDALFEHLQPTLHALYVLAFATEDTWIDSIAQSLRHRPPADFSIKPAFQLDLNHAMRGQRTQYNGAIYLLNSLPSHRSVWTKLELLARICREIDQTIQKHRDTALQPEAWQLTADDLVGLLAFLLVHSPSTCRHAYSHLAILSSFVPNVLAAKEESFALASLTSAAQFLTRLA